MKKSKIYNDCYKATEELINISKVKENAVLIVGCSTSEVLGAKIGTNSAPDTAKEIFDGIYDCAKKYKVFVAIQCCEHLNRAVVISKNAMPQEDGVNVVPQPKAGGSLATVCYQTVENPIVLEKIKADIGMDIGDTLIGMHLKQVAVPVRLSIKKIGKANLVCARTRPKFIGGIRAIYNQDLL